MSEPSPSEPSPDSEKTNENPAGLPQREQPAGHGEDDEEQVEEHHQVREHPPRHLTGPPAGMESEAPIPWGGPVPKFLPAP